jgi:type II secretory pathway pseudopilin PulG
MRTLKMRIKDEGGIAMIVAMGSLMVILLLTAVIATAANQFSNESNKATNAKRAFEAAQAGLNTALARLNTLDPDILSCLADSVLTLTSGTVCGPSSPEPIGNGGSFQYYTSLPLSLGGSCAGVTVADPTVVQRCVTAIGTVNNVTRRVQERTAAYVGAPVFPINGVVGLAGVTLNNSAAITGTIASNGQLSLDNRSTATAAQLGPGGSTKILGSATPCIGYTLINNCVATRTASQGPFVLSPVDFGTTNVNNKDSRITTLADTRGTTGTISWDPTNRILQLNNGASLTLGGDVYNFCSLSMGNGSTITLAAQARTAIYIDSPNRTGSGCPAGSGTLSLSQGSSFVNNSPPLSGSSLLHDSTALQIYVYGDPTNPGGNVVSLNQGATFWGTIDAPNSLVSINNSGAYYGAIGGYQVSFNNGGTFAGDPNDQSIKSSTVGISFVSTWHECTPQPTVSTDPMSGC